MWKLRKRKRFYRQKSGASSKTLIHLCYTHKAQKIAGIAQLVEQWTENPRVTSSSLVPGILQCLIQLIF